ncbi:dihydrolipoamide acetyltransferase family protein [Bacillus sp. Marseille-P3661]|uniref:dihydrolipoamide acetyltransferase family protein n=1 Tax=Bacillus sp. Marseille-P3661 TaxID=1936234 RepID=UPI000C81A533|nr:dihydrolipoamide acetyltransferase family protein [Bacillus sp. Marseille-P3661]
MAVEKITMPQLGESVTEGTISSWLVKPGDTVNKYDPLAEVQTDKVNAEIPSSFSGTIKEIIAAEGETLAVGELLCYIETENSLESPSDYGDQKAEKIPLSNETDVNEQPNKARYSPAVLKLSQEHNINLQQINGTGKGGRITRKDLQKIIDSGAAIPMSEEKADSQVVSQIEKVSLAPTLDSMNVKTSSSITGENGDIAIPVSGVRKAIATNMVRSSQEIPHAWMMVEVDVTNLVAYRDAIKDSFKEKEGYSLTYFAFFVKAVAQALKEFPMINSSWNGDKIIQKKNINISIAVATEDALFVPVIKHADEKTIKGIAREITELANKVRTGKLAAADMQGGTFTVNNTGSFGSIQSMGIINYPQAAILQVESIVKRPVIMNGGMFAARDMVNLCLSLDHRVLDGLICGRFLARVKAILENISKDNTPIF